MLLSSHSGVNNNCINGKIFGPVPSFSQKSNQNIINARRKTKSTPSFSVVMPSFSTSVVFLSLVPILCSSFSYLHPQPLSATSRRCTSRQEPEILICIFLDLAPDGMSTTRPEAPTTTAGTVPAVASLADTLVAEAVPIPRVGPVVRTWEPAAAEKFHSIVAEIDAKGIGRKQPYMVAIVGIPGSGKVRREKHHSEQDKTRPSRIASLWRAC